jgi:hypothetical protein
MPFDGAGFCDRFQTLSKMDKTIDLLGDEARWCTKHWRTHDGRHCIRAAIAAVDGARELERPVALAIRQVTCRTFLHIEHFNDHALTTHALVMQVLRQARVNIATGAEPALPRAGAWARLRHAFT